jgi:16S rRNA (uracil1498-N3)-methyltransferase
MQIFYTTDTSNDNRLVLHDDEARHCSQVLRKKVGDMIDVFDGAGTHYSSVLTEITKKNCVLRVENKVFNQKNDALLHIACCPTKNIERFEWFLEKATEIGIDTVTPLLTQNCERRQIRNDRLDKIVLAAMKQSLRYYLPKINELTPFEDFLAANKDFKGQKLIAHCHNDILRIPFMDLAKAVKIETATETVNENTAQNTAQNTLILIGPEGDFTKKEVEMAMQNGFQSVSLGTARLRTETAAIVACHTFNLLL